MSRTEVLLRDKNMLAGLIFLLVAGVYGYAAYRLPLTVFGTVLIAAFASQRFRLLEGVLLALAVAVLSWVLFRVLLGLSFRMFGSWFG